MKQFNLLRDDEFYFLCGALATLAALYIAWQITTAWQSGYDAGYLDRDERFSDVKSRTVKEDNIFKYPFGTPRGQTGKTGDCDSVFQSGKKPEKEEASDKMDLEP